MTKKVLVIILALVILVSFAGCGNKNKEDAQFGWGTYEKGTYENEFFDFTIDLPESYNYLTPQEIANMNAGTDENGLPDPVNISEIEDLSAEAMVHYVYTTKYDTPPEGLFNPYINIFSENMKYSNDLYNKEDYVENSLHYTALIFNDSGIGVDVYPLEKPWLGDRQFAKGTMKIDYDQFTMFQEMYALTKNNYILVILIGYSNESEKQELYSYIEALNIK